MRIDLPNLHELDLTFLQHPYQGRGWPLGSTYMGPSTACCFRMASSTFSAASSAERGAGPLPEELNADGNLRPGAYLELFAGKAPAPASADASPAP